MSRGCRSTTAVRVTVSGQARVKVTVEATLVEASRKHVEPLAVIIPDLPSVPETWRNSKYVIKSLLGAGDDNAKLRKSNNAGTPYKTWGLTLAPARESGHQTCSSSSPGCRAACLFHQGHARLDSSIAACRLAKTIAWKRHRKWFAARLMYELGAITRRSEARGFRVAVRLNVTSDILWERELPELFERFPDAQFYDYSKHAARMLRFIRGEFPGNYHLTFSRSETNHDEALAVLRAGGNVAVVFRRELPDRWEGHRVVDGDVHDLRFLDPAGVVVGLRAKGTSKLDTSGFVVDIGSRVALPLAGGARP